MSAAAQAVRPKSAPETKRAPETRRAAGELHAMANAAPRYLQAGVQLGGLHDPQEHEAEHAAGVIAAGGQYQVRDPGGSGHLRAAPVVDPGASGRIMRTPAAQQPAARPVVAHPVIDPGASGQIRRAAAHAAEPSLAPAGGEAMRRTAAPDPGGARHPTAAHAPDPVRRAPADMPRVAPGLLDKQAGARIEQARSAASRPLPATVRARLEHGFGESMGSVRVQAGPEGQHAARSIAARAYTEGERITLGPGESEHDMRLMAHEATHVVQNRRAAGIRRLPAEHGPARPKAAEGEVRRTVQPEAQPAAQPGAQPVRRGILDSIVGAGVDSMLDKFADLANAIPGFRLFTIIIGKNPINGQQVDGSGANILRAAIELIPFGALVVQALDKYGVFEKAGAWIDQQVASVKSAGAGLRDALMQFVHTLDITEAIRHPGDVWENAKHIFTEPIEQLKGLFKAAYDSLVAFVKDAILKPLAARASKLAAWDLAIALIGTNPITGDEVPLNADTVVGGLMKLAGQDEIWQNVLKSGAKGRITSWFGGAKAALVGFVRQLPALFLNALKSFQVSDLLDLPGAFLRVAGMFGDFAGRFIGWALDAGWKLLEIVFDVVSPGAFAYIKKTGAALKSILKNPLPFVGNLVKAAKLGLSNFAGNFVDHLKAGLLDWLTGSLPGVYIPKALSLAELGKFALSVLGITWAQIRTKIVKALGPKGETIMQALELAFEVIKALRNGGPAAAWELIKDKLANLRDTVIDGIIGFVTDAVVKKAIPKLVAMFIPGAGFIAAIISIYGTVSAFVEKLSKIVAAVKAFVDSIVAIAQGQIAGAAARVESALAGVLSIAISLLAGFVGLGNVAEKVMGVVKKVQTAVDKGLDVAINWVVNKAKGLFAKLFGKKDAKDERTEAQKQADLDAAVKALAPQVDAILAKSPSKGKLKKQLDSWKKTYRLTSLAIEGEEIIAKINPQAPLSKAEAKRVGLALEPILEKAEAQYLELLKPFAGEPAEDKELAGPGYGPPEGDAIYGTMAAGSRPTPNAVARDVLKARSIREDPASAPQGFQDTATGGRIRYVDPRWPDMVRVSTFYIQSPKGEAAYGQMPPVPNVPVENLPDYQQSILATEQGRSKGMVAAMQTAQAMRDAGVVTTDDLVRGAYNPMRDPGSGAAAERQSWGDKSPSRTPGAAPPEGRQKSSGTKRHVGIATIFTGLREILNRPEYEVLSKPGGGQLLDLAQAFEAWFNASRPTEKKPLDNDAARAAKAKLESSLVQFLNSRLNK